MAAVVGQKLHCRRFKAFIFRSSRAMSSGMTGQTPCLTSRWDQPAQAKKSDVQQLENIGNASLPVTLPGVVRSPGSNSPASQPPEDEATPKGGVEKATAMAAKINAMLMAKGKLLTLPPLLPKKPLTIPVSTPIEEMVVTEVDINDVPINCRELLTKGKTHEEIRLYSGAIVSTKGLYMPDTEQAVGQRPLYLHVQGKTQEQVNKAVIRIKEIISEDVIRASAASGGQKVPVIPPLTLYPQPPRPVIPTPVPRLPNANSVPGQGHRPAAPHTGSFVHTKIFVGLDQALPSFNVKEKVEGPGGSYLSHIQTETGARVFLRGKGSGYIEQASKRESFEPLYVYISHPNAAGLESAKKLTESLLETVRAEQTQMTSMYSAPGATPPYAAHGFPTNSSYSSQGSWYNYPANGFAGGYAAYPGAGGYWSSANGPPSQSNLSKTPSPSSQAMIQYPVCPRKPPPFLVQDPGSSVTVEPEGSLSTPSESGSPKDQSQEGAKDEQPSSCSPGGLAHLESTLPSSSVGEEKVVERILMPPPPSPFVAPPPVTRKRQRDVVPEAPASPTTASASTGVEEVVSVKKPKANVDTSGLVPYGGDSSDEEDERTHSSKTENL